MSAHGVCVQISQAQPTRVQFIRRLRGKFNNSHNFCISCTSSQQFRSVSLAINPADSKPADLSSVRSHSRLLRTQIGPVIRKAIDFECWTLHQEKKKFACRKVVSKISAICRVLRNVRLYGAACIRFVAASRTKLPSLIHWILFPNASVCQPGRKKLLGGKRARSAKKFDEEVSFAC